MSVVLHPPAGPWAVADLEHMSDHGLRVEVHSGSLVIRPPLNVWQSRTATRLAGALVQRGHVAERRVGVLLNEHDLRIADVAVFVAEPTDPRRGDWRPDELRLVVDVLADTSTDADHFEKLWFYAKAGIPEFWRVGRAEDSQDAVIVKFTLAQTADGDPAYVQTGVTALATLEAR